MHVRAILIAFIFLAAGSVELAAQCADGAPPPCGGARRAPVRRTVPNAEARARSFLLLPFRNLTRGEAEDWLVAGSPLMLADALGPLRDLTIVPHEQLTAARRRLALPEAAELDARQLRRMAEETGGWTVVSGNILASGGTLRITAQAVDAATGAVLKRAAVQVAEDADVRAAYDRVAVQLLEAAGLPPHTADLAALTTQSLDAYRAYLRGMSLIYQSQFNRAAQAFSEAVALDSSFALAWARLAAASSAWNLANLVNPFSPVYRASERAVALLPRLPPRVALVVRGQSAFLRGNIAQARALADSVLRTDPDHLDALEMGAAIELIDPVLLDGVYPPRLRGSFNRSLAHTRRVLELDPERRYAYGVMGYVYSLAAGMWGGSTPAVRGESGSLASMFGRRSDVVIVHVLRDSFEVVTDSAFRALPDEERRRLRRRAADAGMQWMERWLAAGSGDAEAHMWASRLEEMRDSLGRALRHAEAADRLRVESPFESAIGRRLMLMLLMGSLEPAGALADSLAAAGRLRLPFLALMDRGFASGALALLATRRFDRAAAVAQAVGGGGTPTGAPCEQLIHPLRMESAAPPPDAVAAMVIDSVVQHAGAFTASAVLRPCLPALVRARPWRQAERGSRLAAVAESLAVAGATDQAIVAARAAVAADSTLRGRLERIR